MMVRIDVKICNIMTTDKRWDVTCFHYDNLLYSGFHARVRASYTGRGLQNHDDSGMDNRSRFNKRGTYTFFSIHSLPISNIYKKIQCT